MHICVSVRYRYRYRYQFLDTDTVFYLVPTLRVGMHICMTNILLPAVLEKRQTNRILTFATPKKL